MVGVGGGVNVEVSPVFLVHSFRISETQEILFYTISITSYLYSPSPNVGNDLDADHSGNSDSGKGHEDRRGLAV